MNAEEDPVARFVHARIVRIALAVLIILSLHPELKDHTGLRLFCLVVFGAELVLRFVAWRRAGARRDETTWILGTLDVLAFLSFVPFAALGGAGLVRFDRALDAFRLVRLLVLLRYARDLAKDIYAIMTRRELLQQFGLVSAAVLFLSFVAAVFLTTLQPTFDFDGDGRTNDPFRRALWWSFRQLESADNLVEKVDANPLVTFVSLLLTVTGVFVVAFIIGIGANVVDQVVRAERRRPVRFRGHSIVVGPVHDGEVLIREFVRIYAKNRAVLRPERMASWLFASSGGLKGAGIPQVALLGVREEMPAFMYDPLLRWVVYRSGASNDPASLARVAATSSKRAILLAHPEAGYEADAVTLAALAAFRAVNPRAHVFAELKDPESCAIARAVGGPGTFPLDVPRFLGLFLCQHLVTRGVEELYRDLLTAEGAEFYTHVFVDDDDEERLARLPPHVSFDELARRAYADHGVQLVGVFLGDAPIGRRDGTIPVDELVPWLNPYELPVDDPRVAALGGAPGRVPTATLRGVVALADSYAPVRRCGAAILGGDGLAPPTIDAGRALVDATRARLRLDEAAPRRVLLLGFSEALPSLLSELSRFVPGVEAMLLLSHRLGEALPLSAKLAALGLGIDPSSTPPGMAGLSVPLPRGGRVVIYTHEGSDLARFATHVLATKPPVDAAVFLNEPDANDRDARVALRVLRFVRHLEENRVPKGDALHVIAEFHSVEKGAYIQRNVDSRRCGFADEEQLKLTLVSTEQIKNYFLVHSAFVPGVAAIYDELLQERGQEIVRLALPPGLSGETTFEELRASCAALPCVPIGVDRRGAPLLMPAATERLQLAELGGVYVVADAARLGRALAADPADARNS